MSFFRALKRRYGHSRTAAWTTASVRTSANDRAADAAFRKAKREKTALEKEWSNKMIIAVGYMRSGKFADQKRMEESAEKAAVGAAEQTKIIDAALRYARLPKEGS